MHPSRSHADAETAAGTIVISFARGLPPPECLPVAELGECAKAALERDGVSALSYGPSAGYPPLRRWIAKYHRVDLDRVVITNGSLQGFVLLADRLLVEGGRVVVERPTYDRPMDSLRRLRADITAVPIDKDGLNTDALEALLDQGPQPTFLYTIPTFQNPSGWTLSADRRRRLAKIAAERDLLVFEDDPYGAIRFDGHPEPTLFELDGGVHVVYANSFSKTIAPGLRVGYLVLPTALAAAVEADALSAYVTPGLFAQATVYEFLRRRLFKPNLERLCGLLRLRRDAILEALDRSFPPGAQWSQPEGGYFVWLTLPDGAGAHTLLEQAEAIGVTFVPGGEFGGSETSARLAFSYANREEIRVGIERLALILDAMPVA